MLQVKHVVFIIKTLINSSSYDSLVERITINCDELVQMHLAGWKGGTGSRILCHDRLVRQDLGYNGSKSDKHAAYFVP